MSWTHSAAPRSTLPAANMVTPEPSSGAAKVLCFTRRPHPPRAMDSRVAEERRVTSQAEVAHASETGGASLKSEAILRPEPGQARGRGVDDARVHGLTNCRSRWWLPHLADSRGLLRQAVAHDLEHRIVRQRELVCRNATLARPFRGTSAGPSNTGVKLRSSEVYRASSASTPCWAAP